MQTILCYGDSNTWGDAPGQSMRYGLRERWPGVMRDLLGEAYWIIEEGLPGRTTVHSDPIEGAHKNGLAYLPACMESHVPLDMVILMLGTNDLKKRFSLSAYDIAQGAGMLVHFIQQGTWGIKPEVLLVAPPPLAKMTHFAQMFEGGLEKSQGFAEQYQRVANELKCHYFNAASVITTSDIDGVHFEPEAHRQLGEAMAAEVRKILR